MKKIIIPAITSFFILPALIFADVRKEDFSFSIEPLFGLKNGVVDEFVYKLDCAYDDNKWSELNWDIKNELYGGLKLNGEFRNIFLETSFTAGIPKSSGITKDSDWRNIECTNAEDYQYKTNYSEHDNYFDYDIGAKVKAGYSFKLLQDKKVKLALKPFAEFQYENFQFTCKDGTCWYGAYSNGHFARWNDWDNQADNSGDKSGDVMSYQRQNLIIWLGGDIEVALPKNFTVFTGFKFSPYLYSESIDSHYLTSTYYLDITPGYFGAFDCNLGVEYAFTKRQSITLGAEGFYMRELEGDDYINNTKKWYRNGKAKDADGGSAQRYINITLSYKYKFL